MGRSCLALIIEGGVVGCGHIGIDRDRGGT